MGRNVTSYKSAAAVVDNYLSSLSETQHAASNSSYKMQSDVIKEREAIKEKAKENRDAQRKQNLWRGIARSVGTAAGVISDIVAPGSGRFVGGAISGVGQLAVRNTVDMPDRYKKSDYKFSKGIVDRQNEALRDYKNELGMKIALGTITDAMNAGNIGELVRGKLGDIAESKAADIATNEVNTAKALKIPKIIKDKRILSDVNTKNFALNFNTPNTFSLKTPNWNMYLK